MILSLKLAPGELINAVSGWANVMKKNSGDDYGTDEDNDVFSITKVGEAVATRSSFDPGRVTTR